MISIMCTVLKLKALLRFFFFDEKCVIFHVIYQVIIMELSNLLREIKKMHLACSSIHFFLIFVLNNMFNLLLIIAHCIVKFTALEPVCFTFILGYNFSSNIKHFFHQQAPIESKAILKSFIPHDYCDNNFISLGNLQIVMNQKYETFLSGIVHLLQDFDQSIGLTTIVFEHNGTSFMSSSLYPYLCQEFERISKAWVVSIEPINSGCPIRKGTYSVFNIALRHPEHIESGSYRMEIVIAQPIETRICGASLTFDIVEG